MLTRDADTVRLADRLARCSALYAVGRGYSLCTAVELALKVEETCRLTAVGLSYADLQHGPLAVVGAGPAVVVTAGPDGPTLPGLTDLATRARRAGACTLGLGGDARLRAACDDAVAGPDLPESVAPIVGVIPAQLLTEHLARRLGHDPDVPAGLTKVTQTS